VAQGSWYSADASSNKGASISTRSNGITASLEAGYPLHWCPDNEWQIEPQAQIIYQNFTTGSTTEKISQGISTNPQHIRWGTSEALTGRLGLRLQHTSTSDNGMIWQPYARLNVWESFNGTDTVSSNGATADTRFGGTSIEGGLGLTAKLSKNVSIYGEADTRHSIDNNRQKLSSYSGTVGVRVNW
jgi:outer membrane autotransporter protein